MANFFELVDTLDMEFASSFSETGRLRPKELAKALRDEVILSGTNRGLSGAEDDVDLRSTANMNEKGMGMKELQFARSVAQRYIGGSHPRN